MRRYGVLGYPLRNPMTFCYLVVLAATYVLVQDVLSAPMTNRLLQDVSTNTRNLEHDPVLVVLGSMLIADTSGAILDNVLILGVGVAVCLAVLERRTGMLRAAGIFVVGHVMGTAVATIVTVIALHAGRYPAEIRDELDYGVSYGALTAGAAITPLLPRWSRLPWATFAVLYPLTAATWYGALPDVTTVGHITAALTGLLLGFTVVRSRSRSRNADRPTPGDRPTLPDSVPG